MKRVIKRSLKKYQLAGEVNDQVPPTFGATTFNQMYGSGVQTFNNPVITQGSPTVQINRGNLQMGANMLFPTQLPAEPLWDGSPQQSFRPQPTTQSTNQNWGNLIPGQTPQASSNFEKALNTSYRPKVYNATTGQYETNTTQSLPSAGNTPLGETTQPAAVAGQPAAVAGQPTTEKKEGDEYIQGDANGDGIVDEKDKVDKFGNPLNSQTEKQGEIKNPKKIQFFNPYGNVDIPTAASVLGSSIENKDSLGIVGSSLKLATGLGRNIMGGMGAQNRNNQIMEDYMSTQKRDMKKVEGRDGGYFGDGEFKQFIPEFKSGGEVDLAQALTGEYLGGMNKENPMKEPNAEIENNEMVQHPSGEIQQAVGDTHEKGGIDVALEEGTRILSDHLKLGRDAAKKLSKDFDLKLKASDTYAKALEKYNSKSGLTKIVDEQEQNIVKLEKQSEIKNEETQGLNTQYLSNKINELEESKKPLEEGKKEMFEKLFEIQEKSKPKNEKEQEIFKEGGVVKALSEKYGITEERARELTSSMFLDGGEQDEEGFPPPGFRNPYVDIQNIGKGVDTSGLSDAEYFQNEATKTATKNVYGAATTYSPEEKELIKAHYAKFIKDPQSLKTLINSIDNNQLVFNPGMLETIKTGQVLPIQLQKKDGSDETYGGQDEARINGYLYNDTFKQKTGRDFNPNSPEDTKLIYGVVTSALKEKGIDYNGAPFNNQKTDAYGNIVASEPGFKVKMEASKEGKIDLDKFRKATPGQKQLIADEYKVNISDIEKEAKNDANKFLNLTKGNNTNSSPQAQVTQQEEELKSEVEVNAETEEERDRTNLLLLPDQTPMRPDSLQAHLKVKRRYERVNPALISPEQNIVELNRQESGMVDTINSVPGAHRAAALANLTATSQDNINKTFQHANTFNSQAVAQADNINARTQAMEENAGAMDALSYEQRQFRAKSLTDNDIRNYFNTIKQNGVRNYNEINNINAANAMAEHYQYDGNNYIQTDTPTFGDNKVNIFEEEVDEKKKPKKRTKKAAARLGGRFSNKK